ESSFAFFSAARLSAYSKTARRFSPELKTPQYAFRRTSFTTFFLVARFLAAFFATFFATFLAAFFFVTFLTAFFFAVFLTAFFTVFVVFLAAFVVFLAAFFFAIFFAMDARQPSVQR
ncbi:MAG: hypothetical protein ACR2NF_03820, partial [Pirellulales bacterium]